jgi:hypothetical protein
MADGATINNILDYFLVLKIVIEHTGCSSNEKVIIGSGDVERLVGDAYNALGTNELEWQHFYHLVLFIFLLEAVLSQRGGGLMCLVSSALSLFHLLQRKFKSLKRRC